MLHSLTVDFQDIVKKRDADILNLVKSLGGDARKYVRERSCSVRHLEAEIYSPPRATAAAKLSPELGCIPGLKFDITVRNEFGNLWSFGDASQRRGARERVERHRPLILVASPMCTALSA